MFNLKPCPLSKHSVNMFVVAGHCPRISCQCGLEYQSCDIRDPQQLADVWNAKIEDNIEIPQYKDHSDAWYAVCKKLDALHVNRHQGMTGLAGVLIAIEGLKETSETFGRIVRYLRSEFGLAECSNFSTQETAIYELFENLERVAKVPGEVPARDWLQIHTEIELLTPIVRYADHTTDLYFTVSKKLDALIKELGNG